MKLHRGPAPQNPQAQRRASMHDIGMWGPIGSGKTTFLAALNIAAMRSQSRWKLVGTDDEATDFLVDQTHSLVEERVFPPATVAIKPFRWSLIGRAEVPAGRRWGREITEEVTLEVNLDLLDVGGGMFDRVPTTPARDGDELGFGEEPDRDDDEVLFNHLAGQGGIVYLYDPVREADKGDAFRFFNRTLERLKQRSFEQRGFTDGYLPQHLAVCVTKFDHKTVYDRIRSRGLRSVDDTDEMLPRVRDEDAAEAFRELCSITHDGGADLVRRAIENNFHPDRVAYFVTSAVGFHVGPSGRFMERDFQNVVVGPDGKARIRGPVRPINVLEPVLWLAKRLAVKPR
ncbi:hypothetical protein [Streptosporangium sp. NPDC051022]|uniref:hypothetical protein n=1 Tax=Streptosporangium sp. NPDC051022 TaxID=3155752 RepID=UPI0034195318